MDFALTFDDGPGPSTGALLDVLDAAGARATFFLLGRNLSRAPWGDPAAARALALRMIGAGHVVGNHTMEHQFPITAVDLAREIAEMDALLAGLYAELTVPPRPIPLRLPYGVRLEGGVMDPRLAVIGGLGRPHVHWSSDFDDWTLAAGDGPRLGAHMIAHVAEMAAEGRPAVLDLHDSGTGSKWGYARPATVEGVAILLAEAGRRGWRTFQAPR